MMVKIMVSGFSLVSGEDFPVKTNPLKLCHGKSLCFNESSVYLLMFFSMAMFKYQTVTGLTD